MNDKNQYTIAADHCQNLKIATHLVAAVQRLSRLGVTYVFTLNQPDSPLTEEIILKIFGSQKTAGIPGCFLRYYGISGRNVTDPIINIRKRVRYARSPPSVDPHEWHHMYSSAWNPSSEKNGAIALPPRATSATITYYSHYYYCYYDCYYSYYHSYSHLTVASKDNQHHPSQRWPSCLLRGSYD